MTLQTQNTQIEAFAHVTYVVGDTKLGWQRTSVTFEAHPIYLLVRRRSDGQSLLAIPWANIRGIEENLVEKSYTGKAVADLFSFIPILNSLRVASGSENGLTLIYWDEETQWEKTPAFAIGNDPRRFATLEYVIMVFRDRFIAPLGPNSKPNRR